MSSRFSPVFLLYPLKTARSQNQLIWNSGTQEVLKTAWNQAPDTVPVMTKGLFKGAIVPFALFS
jgi:hypothetical protein